MNDKRIELMMTILYFLIPMFCVTRVALKVTDDDCEVLGLAMDACIIDGCNATGRMRTFSFMWFNKIISIDEIIFITKKNADCRGEYALTYAYTLWLNVLCLYQSGS